ncbi:uncharacterized protein DUF1080 [Maribacter vaceletii]|uniref:Uncharacterized protein DUF1080 n=1 Tax=Maribacter vaceletii TaxID=1206816 RepID=A0A495EBX8_9FLAO|nr:DUF1080 domain-containing protein [Maribacter vaceletii]RKR14326.1 uncharacterized protein DUF1080 [Maribacter vaceletii]
MLLKNSIPIVKKIVFLIVFLSITVSNTFAQHSINPFPKGEINTTYTTSEKPNPENNKLFTVKNNRIEVLYTWKGNKAPFGIITTRKEYSHYNLELQYKWGERKFKPRLEDKRDAGILFHIQGEKVVWPSSLECQIQEHDTGDLWVIKGPAVIVIEKNGVEKKLDSSGDTAFLQNIKYEDHEIEGWNTVRLEVRGSKSARFYVNGNLINEIKNFVDKDKKPLSKGQIALQAEGAEITYRNIQLEELQP